MKALQLFIAGWEKPQMPSDLASFLVNMHSVLCLNKQRGLDKDDQAILDGMNNFFLHNSKIEFEPASGDYRKEDAHLRRAIKQAVREGVPTNTPMTKVLDSAPKPPGQLSLRRLIARAFG